MREEYRIDELNPRKNPYVSQAEEQVTISVDGSTVDYFQSMEGSTGIPIPPSNIARSASLSTATQSPSPSGAGTCRRIVK